MPDSVAIIDSARTPIAILNLTEPMPSLDSAQRALAGLAERWSPIRPHRLGLDPNYLNARQAPAPCRARLLLGDPDLWIEGRLDCRTLVAAVGRPRLEVILTDRAALGPPWRVLSWSRALHDRRPDLRGHW